MSGTGAEPGGSDTTPDPTAQPSTDSTPAGGPTPDPTFETPVPPAAPTSPAEAAQPVPSAAESAPLSEKSAFDAPVASAAEPVSEWARPAEGPATPPLGGPATPPPGAGPATPPVEAWGLPVPPPDDQPAPLFPFPQPPPPFAGGAYPPPQTGGYPPPEAGAYPPPGYQPGAYGQYPPTGWPAPAAAPAGRRRGGVLAGVIVGAVVVIGLLCAGSIYMVANDQSDSSSADGGFGQSEPFVWPSEYPFPTDLPSEAPTPESTDPQPAASPLKDMYDLNAVCDENAFFPEAPKRAGKAPHPVALLIQEGDGDVRWNNGTYYMEDIGTSKTDENTWGPRNPSKVQMAACLDRTSVGSKLRSCKYDAPTAETVTLYRANWRLRVFEVATHRQLLDKKLTGNETTCPYTVLVGPDKKIYANVTDHTIVTTLKSLVIK